MKNYQSTIFNISGMHCVACSNRLEKLLNSIEGIYKASVNFASETAYIQYHAPTISEDKIIEKANVLGFTLREQRSNLPNKALTKEISQVVVAWGLTLILLVDMLWGVAQRFPYLEVIIAGITIIGPGFHIIKNALASLKTLDMGMDVLIALGAIAAWLSSLLPLFGIAIPDYSMTASMLIAVNLTGRLLETLAKGSASKAISSLANLNGKTAHKVLENGDIEDVPIDTLMIGDTIQIKAGEKVPTDGVIITGKTSVDESFLTGESLPIEKQEQDYLYGGALNIDGFVTLKVEKESTNTLLAQTIKLIQEAQGTKVPIQIFADKVTNIFVPIILTLSFLSFAIWFAFPDSIPNILAQWDITSQGGSRLTAAISAAIAVLVIACPCALGLATPMALINGSTLGAKKGILICRGAAVQNLGNINIVALDKTGTLTIGKPKITELVSEKLEHTKILEILTGLETLSTHPLAHAVMTYGKEKGITPYTLTDTKNVPGEGIYGTYDNQDWFAGSLKKTLEKNIYLSDTLDFAKNTRQELGESLVCLSNITTGTCEAIICFSDQLNPDAVDSIKALKKMGKKILMITGDHQKAAQSIAKELGIKSIISECSPEQKLNAIISLQQQEYKVCFVGDGINDAAALEKADVGIAMGTGTDIAAESSDLILATGSLTSLVLAFRLAKAIFSKIKQNLFWAFFYNCVAIPLAFLGLLHPIVAEIAMTFSSLTVIGNSILLSHKKLS